MYFDGRYKSIVYHGRNLGELFDLREDPREFVNLRDEPGTRDLRGDLLHRHFDAVMATSSAGIDRSGIY
jgi:arylsulfatase